jgi:hypothetical protein
MYKLIVLLASGDVKLMFIYWEERNIKNSILEIRNEKNYIGGKEPKTEETQLQENLLNFFINFIEAIPLCINTILYDVSIYIQGVPGGMCQTSGGCSLC